MNRISKKGWISTVLIAIFLAIALLCLYTLGAKNKFIVITDLEPDDRIALHILAARIPKNEVLFVGATIKNAARKKELVRKLLDQLQWKDIPVYQGSGGAPESYHDIVSSRAAREYAQEGEHLLPEVKLEQLKHANYSSQKLQDHIEIALKNNHDLQFILLAPPTDLVAVLEKNPALKKHIKHIYIMGGWSELQEDGKTVLRTTYNWNMDPEASAKLLEMNDIPMTLYSSHTIKDSFDGGSCNIDNCRVVIERMSALQSQLPSLQDQEIAALSWDEHIMAKIPVLKDVIEPYKGKQFTPADPLVIVGIINPKLIVSVEAIDIHIDVNDLDKAKGFRLFVTPNAQSKIQLVQAIDVDIFKKETIRSLEMLASSKGTA